MRARWSAVGIAGLLASSACAIQPNDHTLPGQTAVGDDGYSVTVRFAQIENLVPNSTVQKDNVVIGTVTDIDTEGWEAVVGMRLLRDTRLPGHAVFSIGQKTLLGAQYVEVTVPPSSASATGGQKQGGAVVNVLEHGDVVPVEQTGAYPATEQVLGGVALLLNNGGLSQISTVTGELSTALQGRVPNTRTLIGRADRLLAVLDANRDEIVAALESLDSLSAGLRGDSAEIVDAIERITPALRVLEAERTRLVRAVTDTARTSKRAVRVVQASEAALLANLDSLGPILSNLGQVSESLPEALKMAVTIPFPGMTTKDAIQGDYFNLFTTLDLTTGSLSDLWLRGLPPELQAGDPVRDPVTVPGKPAEGPAAGLLDQVGGLVELVELPAGQADAPEGAGGQGGCLLALLGAC